MAIGDAVAVYMGTGTVNRQPASGVEEQIMAIVKYNTTDAINTFDGVSTATILAIDVKTDEDPADTAQRGLPDYNISIMITNSMYLRKDGTTDRIYIGGVQTNV